MKIMRASRNPWIWIGVMIHAHEVGVETGGG
jgi:hypothetical protein